jgi:diaminohydroxyphosphoribosylaminopyrimidine deaminase/5-amino-6-(5-phosphoribosylamino)uracil reductase
VKVRMREGGRYACARGRPRRKVTVDERWMTLSLELAGAARPHPNPRVGAVIVGTDGSVAGTGSHAGPGSPHAEVLALDEAGSRAQGATLYVTLEPCVHQGRTPPCVDAIVAAGISRVVLATEDPDSRVSGQGIRRLRDAGIEVVVGVEEDAARQLDRGYFRHRQAGLPWVTLKAAATLDGQVAAADGTSKWITSDAAREDAHRLRAEADAVMVGAGTVRSDDPLLNVRLPGYEGPQPVPVVVAGGQPLPAGARVLAREAIVLRPARDSKCVDLDRGLRSLADQGLLDILVEGGPKLAAALLRDELVNRLVLYLAPSLGGGLGRAMFDGVFPTLSEQHPVEIAGVDLVGSAVRIEAFVEVH